VEGYVFEAKSRAKELGNRNNMGARPDFGCSDDHERTKIDFFEGRGN